MLFSDFVNAFLQLLIQLGYFDGYKMEITFSSEIPEGTQKLVLVTYDERFQFNDVKPCIKI